MAHVQRIRPPLHRAQAGPAHRLTGPGTSAWYGWLLFVSIVLVGTGVITMVQGLVPLFENAFYPAPTSELADTASYLAWGWVFLALGALLVGTGCGIAAGSTWARVVGVVVAAIDALAILAFALYPMWTTIVVGLDILSIYVLVVHGGKGRALRDGQRRR